MPFLVQADNLTKNYGGGRGIHQLNLAIEAGEIFGCLGPNGAGKTTTIRLMLNFIKPTAGRLLLFGEPPGMGGRKQRRRIGFLPGELGLPEAMSAEAALDFYAALNGVGKPLQPWLCDLLALSRRDLRRQIKHFSKGTKQKIGIIQAIQHDPDLVILDEPTGGLDPLMQTSFFEILRELKGRGKTIFFSSHVLAEVQRLCDRVAVLREGRLVLISTLPELAASAQRHLWVRFAGALGPQAQLDPAPIIASTSATLTPPRLYGLQGAIQAVKPSATEGSAVAASGSLPVPPMVGPAKFVRQEGLWLLYEVAPGHVPEVLEHLARLKPADFRLESALEDRFLQLYATGTNETPARQAAPL